MISLYTLASVLTPPRRSRRKGWFVPFCAGLVVVFACLLVMVRVP